MFASLLAARDTRDVATVVRSNQAQSYVQAVSLTLLLQDWLILLPEEIDLIWRKKWSFAKVLYILSRYTPFADNILGTISHFSPKLSPEACHQNDMAVTLLLGLGIWLSELILVWRTYAIYNQSRKILWGLGGLWAILIPPSLYCIISFILSTHYEEQPFSNLPGCNLVSSNMMAAGGFIALLLIEFVIVVLTVTKGVRHVRTTSVTRLAVVLYRDGVLFFICLFSLSLANLLVPLIGGTADAVLLPLILRVMHGNLCCRVILHIREAADAAPVVHSASRLPSLWQSNERSWSSRSQGTHDTVELARFDRSAGRPSTSNPKVHGTLV